MVEATVSIGRPTVVARPVVGEAQLPPAVLTDVLRALANWMPRLLPEQRAVLEAAAGGVAEVSTDRLLLAAATRVVDDSQWTDPASGRGLSFRLWRLLATGC